MKKIKFEEPLDVAVFGLTVVGLLLTVFIISFVMGIGFKYAVNAILTSSDEYQSALEKSAEPYDGVYPVVEKYSSSGRLYGIVSSVSTDKEYYIVYGFDVEGYPNNPYRDSVSVDEEVYNNVDTSYYYDTGVKTFIQERE